MTKIIECVPNFSEGRSPEIYNAIADAIRDVPGTHVLDVSADPDHNRSVITFVGSPDAVLEGAFRAIAMAAELIDLDHHVGEHPRIGATDVVPFIPVKGASVEECIALAQALGKRVGDDLGIAVYLYGEAATRPDRKLLSNIRRGEYESWRDEVATNPERLPDFGPAVAKPWGATVIGVRAFLIAYNLYLNSDDVEIANRIARAVRFSSGGLRYVQALGFLVEGQAQVSMNLTNFERTPIHRVQELVSREAAQYGLAITKAELVGMIPEKALLESAKWYLQLNEIDDSQILELRIAQEQEQELAPLSFFEATASATPTPGGGSAAALAGALGSSLNQMVSGLTTGRKKYQDVEDETLSILDRSKELQYALSSSISEDAAAFQDLMATWRRQDLAEEEKAIEIEKATIHAAEVPYHVARLSCEVARLALRITEIGNANAVTDAAAAAILAQAAVRIAAMNVRINAVSLPGDDQIGAWMDELDDFEVEAQQLADSAAAVAAERGGF